MRNLFVNTICLILLNSCGVNSDNHVQQSEASPVPAAYSAQVFAGRLITQCRAQISQGKTQILVNQLAAVTQDIFQQDYAAAESYMLLVCIESRFQSGVVSKAGAVGYSQIMPKYAQGFADACGLGKLDLPKDLYDGELNLRLGACHFRSLLEQFSGNTALALAGYNSGPDSKTTKALTKLSEIGAHPETLGYLAKFSVLTEQMRIANNK